MDGQTGQFLVEDSPRQSPTRRGTPCPPEASATRTADFVLDTHVGGRPVRFVLEAKRALFPRDARKAAWQLRNDLSVSDPLQTYLDLLQTGRRAKELAQHLRAEALEA